MKKKRKLGGKNYELDTTWSYKRDAKARARDLRRRGQLARVIKNTRKRTFGMTWLVYSR